MENSGQFNRFIRFAEHRYFWICVFLSVSTGYCLCYAPYGINETDGGFLTGLAWQILSGKTLYSDVIYIRPPLPVWLRVIELQLLPEHWAVLGERWIFYFKIGLYSWLGAAVLTSGTRRWMLAVFGFVVSAHNYPPMAWHTIDGILFSVLGVWCLSKISSGWGAALAGILMFAALLCKQSFYPMAAVFAGLLLFTPGFRKVIFTNRAKWGAASFFLCTILFFSYLYSNDLIANYFRMTGGAASGGQAFQHGVLDYFRIKPALAAVSLLLLTPAAWYVWKEKNLQSAAWMWLIWLVILAGSYACEIRNHQTFTVPFAQVRLLFWVGFVFTLLSNRPSLTTHHSPLTTRHSPLATHHSPLATPHFPALLAVSWCASVSWGYNLPVLFATPWVFATMEISGYLWQRAYPKLHLNTMNIVALIGLLFVFRCGYEFVYRDGRRSDMNTALGAIFPALQGIYSTAAKGLLYSDLKNLAVRYPDFKTLPAFPQANFLTKTHPPLPLDWVVNRETNSDNTLIIKKIEEKRPVLFIEKSWAEKYRADPELSLTRTYSGAGTILDETPHFWVVKPE